MMCSGEAFFQRAKSRGLRFSLWPSRLARVPASWSSMLRFESLP